MGNRYIISVNCAYCKKLNSEVYYAPTSLMFSFDCRACHLTNIVTSDLNIKRLEDTFLEDLKSGFVNNSFGNLSDYEVRVMCTQTLEELIRRKR